MKSYYLEQADRTDGLGSVLMALELSEELSQVVAGPWGDFGVVGDLRGGVARFC